MRLGSTFALAIPAFVSAGLLACSSEQHQNTTNPNYGEAQYKADLAECRRQNSRTEIDPGLRCTEPDHCR